MRSEGKKLFQLNQTKRMLQLMQSPKMVRIDCLTSSSSLLALFFYEYTPFLWNCNENRSRERAHTHTQSHIHYIGKLYLTFFITHCSIVTMGCKPSKYKVFGDTIRLHRYKWGKQLMCCVCMARSFYLTQCVRFCFFVCLLQNIVCEFGFVSVYHLNK